jgi:hypothetical protein
MASNPDGLHLYILFVHFLVVLGVVDLDQEHVYLDVLSNNPCRSTASGPVKLTPTSYSKRADELVKLVKTGNIKPDYFSS